MSSPRVAYLLRTRSLGGAEIQSVRAAAALAGRGHPVSVWTLDHSAVAAEAERAGLPVVALRRGPIAPSSLAGVGVLHVHEPRDLPWALLAASGAGVAVVATRHLAASPRRRRDPYHAWLVGRTRFVTASRFVQQSVVAAYGVVPERVTVVPYGYAPAISTAASSHPRGASFSIGMLSRISHGKHLTDALDVLVTIMRRGVTAELTIAGEETDRGARAELLRAARAHGVSERVHLLGFRRDVPELLGRFDVLLHTAHAESFGLAILEAMAHGCPVVASAGGGVPELIEHRRTGWLAPPGDVPALADGVATLRADPELAGALASAARARVARDFTPTLEAERLARLYRVLTGG